MQDDLGFPDKRDPNKWSASELKLLNNILQTHVVTDKNGCSLHTLVVLTIRILQPYTVRRR